MTQHPTLVAVRPLPDPARSSATTPALTVAPAPDGGVPARPLASATDGGVSAVAPASSTEPGVPALAVASAADRGVPALTATSATDSGVPALAVVPGAEDGAPAPTPVTEDGRPVLGVAAGGVVGALAVEEVRAGRVQAVEVVGRPVLVVVGARAGAGFGGGAVEGPGVPDVRVWAMKLVQAVTEVLAGDRPISQLVRWTDAAVFTDLNRRVRVLGLTTTATVRGAKERCSVRSVHVCNPAAEVAEVSAHVRYGERSRAMAFRLEVRRGRWVCTALEVG